MSTAAFAHRAPSRRFLRWLIGLELACAFVGGLVSLFTESFLPEPLRAFQEAQLHQGFSLELLIELAIALPLLLAVFVSRLGLFFFWRPARLMYLLTTIFGLALSPVFGPYVDAGWGLMLQETSVVLSGTVLALVYYSPLKELFDEPNPAG